MTSTLAERIQHELLPRISKPNRYLGRRAAGAAQAAGRGRRAGAARVPRRVRDRLLEPRHPHPPPRAEPARPTPRPSSSSRPGPTPRPRCAAWASRCSRSTRTRRPPAFDVLGFSLQYELQYTNVLTMLDLAGLPLRSLERDGRHPLVIAGGAQAFSPEPMAEFVDAFVIGDGEEIVHRVVDLVRAGEAGAARRGPRCCGGSPACPASTCRAATSATPRPRAGSCRGRGPATRRAWSRSGCGELRAGVLPGRAAAAGRRDHARPALGRDHARLHARLPLLPGGHDQPPGAREAGAADRRGGAARRAGDRARGGLARLALLDRPHADRRDWWTRWPASCARPRVRIALPSTRPGQPAAGGGARGWRRRSRARSRWRPRPAASACAT